MRLRLPAGVAVQLIEASDGVGGRVRSQAVLPCPSLQHAARTSACIALSTLCCAMSVGAAQQQHAWLRVGWERARRLRASLKP